MVTILDTIIQHKLTEIQLKKELFSNPHLFFREKDFR